MGRTREDIVIWFNGSPAHTLSHIFSFSIFFLSPSQGALCPLSANVFAFFSPKRPTEREKKKKKFPEKIREKISIIRQRTEHKSRRSFTEAVEDLHHHNPWTLFKFSNPRRQPLRLCGVKSGLLFCLLLSLRTILDSLLRAYIFLAAPVSSPSILFFFSFFGLIRFFFVSFFWVLKP